MFKRRKEPKAGVSTYDSYFLIFGNSEIRIRAQEKKVYSNFGITASTFDPEGLSYKEFLGTEGGNEVEIESYEIYQIQP